MRVMLPQSYEQPAHFDFYGAPTRYSTLLLNVCDIQYGIGQHKVGARVTEDISSYYRQTVLHVLHLLYLGVSPKMDNGRILRA